MRTALTWFKSSYSGSEGGACLEVAHDSDGETRTLHVRDSKDLTVPTLTVGPNAWTAFLQDVSGRD